MDKYIDLEINLKDNMLEIDLEDDIKELEINSNDVVVKGTDYNILENKPKINDITLQGNKTFEELGLESLTNSELEKLLK